MKLRIYNELGKFDPIHPHCHTTITLHVLGPAFHPSPSSPIFQRNPSHNCITPVPNTYTTLFKDELSYMLTSTYCLLRLKKSLRKHNYTVTTA